MTKKTEPDLGDSDSEAVIPNKYAKDPTKPIKLVKFGADWCGHCVAMSKSKTLENLAAKFTDVEVIIVDVEKDEEMADDYEVTAMPSIFFEDAQGYILAEHEANISAAQLEKLYFKAKSKVINT